MGEDYVLVTCSGQLQRACKSCTTAGLDGTAIACHLWIACMHAILYPVAFMQHDSRCMQSRSKLFRSMCWRMWKLQLMTTLGSQCLGSRQKVVSSPLFSKSSRPVAIFKCGSGHLLPRATGCTSSLKSNKAHNEPSNAMGP
jgi:hypothetical protein